jgi:hypothetical protein
VNRRDERKRRNFRKGVRKEAPLEVLRYDDKSGVRTMTKWQKGVFEIIDPGKTRTAPPLYPKPAWQPPESKK